MKLTEFTYTKRNGDVSKRAVIVTGEPNKFLRGIDVSELDNCELGWFINKLRAIEDRYAAERATLVADYDLTHNFRQFDPELISDQAVEWV